MSSATEIQEIQTRILQILPTFPKKLTQSEIKVRLGADAPEDKTLQRYLKKLAEIPTSGVECDTRERPYQWGFCKGHTAGLHNPTQAQAITLQLAKQILWDVFPKPMQDELKPLFSASETVIRNSNPKLIKKIAVIPPAQTLIAPQFKHNVREAIGTAIYEDIAFEGEYRNIENIVKTYTFHPLAILQRGIVLYLIARVNDYQDPRFFALHRFEKAKILPSVKANTRQFNLNDYLNSGAGGFIQRSETIKLVLRSNTDLLFYLKETPLSEDQCIRDETEAGATIEATLVKTEQLIWWLLSWSYGVEVISPKSLRDEIASRLKQAAKKYK